MAYQACNGNAQRNPVTKSTAMYHNLISQLLVRMSDRHSLGLRWRASFVWTRPAKIENGTMQSNRSSLAFLASLRHDLAREQYAAEQAKVPLSRLLLQLAAMFSTDLQLRLATTTLTMFVLARVARATTQEYAPYLSAVDLFLVDS